MIYTIAQVRLTVLRILSEKGSTQEEAIEAAAAKLGITPEAVKEALFSEETA